MFQNPIDIANRALDHCGQEPIDAALGFDEDSKKARLIGRIYDKLRQAELRRIQWKFATRKVAIRAITIHTMLLSPTLWSASTTYYIGSIVMDGDGILWISNTVNNLNNEPGPSPFWEPYFGPMTVHPYDSTTSYFKGELVYLAAGDGTYVIYRSIVDGNTDDPSVPTDWETTTVYFQNQIVNYLGTLYQSLINLNLNQTPSATSPPLWESSVTYLLGQAVRGSDGTTYTSVIGGNIGNDPVLDSGANWTNTGVLTAWTTQFTGGSGSGQWLEITAALESAQILYPISASPSGITAGGSAFHLPGNFLREAPQDPKAGSSNYLGAPTNALYRDWLYEGNYLISWWSGVIIYRFIADIVDVRGMDPMFCEGLALRIGLEICEPLTQSADKLATIASSYKKFMTEAGMVDAVERGPEESPLDDYLACRA